MMPERDPPRNAVLRRLPPDELRRLRPHLRRADLAPGKGSLDGRAELGVVWFPEAGFLSVLLRDGCGGETEVAMVGREGAVGVGGPEGGPGGAGWRLVAQQWGVAHVLAPERLSAAAAAAPALPDALGLASAELLAQMAATAHANARDCVRERLARWLLMAHDRVNGDALHVTHDVVAARLGVRRVGVTNALHLLEGERLVRAHRGRVRVLDRAGLAAATNGLYAPHRRPDRETAGEVQAPPASAAPEWGRADRRA